MKIGFSNFYHGLNAITFTERNAPIGDDLLLPFNRLAQLGARRGVFFEALTEKTDIDSLDAVLFADMPDLRIPWIHRCFLRGLKYLPRYLITFENEVIRPQNFDEANHILFTRVFTWADWLAGSGPRYVKLNYAQEWAGQLGGPAFESRKLATLVASNKYVEHPLELYSARRHTIEWFMKFHPRDLDLYGPGWPATWPVYRGPLPPGQKRINLAHYRFAICYENAENLPGYITEKLFDCLLAGCVPIYWGAPNISHWIPWDCYLDRRQFCDHSMLYTHLAAMSEATWEAYRGAARSFLASLASAPFSTTYFAETILREIAG